MIGKRVDTKKIFAFAVIALFLSVFLVQFVVAAEPFDGEKFRAALSGGDSGSNTVAEDGLFKSLWNVFFGGIFDGTSGFNLNPMNYEFRLSQLFLGILLALMVYSITDFLPFVADSDKIKWPFSIIVALLGFLFMDSDTVLGIASTYGAMGVVLTSLIPLLILFAFSFKLQEDDKFKPYASFITAFMFGLFAVWMLIKWDGEPTTTYKMAYLAAAVGALIWIFVSKYIFVLAEKWRVKASHESGRTQGNDDAINTAQRKIDDYTAQLGTTTNKEEKKRLTARIQALDDNIQSLIALR